MVTKGEIFDDRTKIEFVLVDGNKYVPAPEAVPAGTWRRGGRGERTQWSEKIMKRTFLAGLLALAPLGAQQVTVIQNATIMSEGAKGTFKGSIVVKDGKITEVGDKVMVPPGATIVDAQGQYVIPGIIDAHLAHRGRRRRE